MKGRDFGSKMTLISTKRTKSLALIAALSSAGFAACSLDKSSDGGDDAVNAGSSASGRGGANTAGG
ncbi:MAG TPA: hypothetical protein VGK73_19115, partial [Polyangiaceae bacterium]